jgi:hypothetical protein
MFVDESYVGNFLSVGNKKNIITDEFTDEKGALKKNLPASFRRNFPWKACHITNKNIVCNFIRYYLKIFFKIIYLTKLEK